jgi:cytochrome P450
MAFLAYPLPGSVSAHALGLPDDMHDQAMEWCNELLHSTWPTTGRTDKGEGIAESFPELTKFLDEEIAERHRRGPRPDDDLLGVMVHSSEADGWHIPDDHIRTLTVNILAGSLSASFTIGSLLYRYLAEPEGFAAALAADRSRIPAAVEESLRFEPPVLFMFRHATEDMEISGCPVATGEHLMLSIASANRDESVYDDPETFRLDRVEPAEHLSFGFGPHLCLGNHLTRMVGRVILEEMLDRFPPGTASLAPGFEWVCVDHMLEYGPERLEAVAGAH